MESLQLLVSWAKEKGVKLNGIKPMRIPGRGTGIVASRRLKKGEHILTIPLQAVLSLDTVPQNISRKLTPGMSIHGLLALDLVINKTVELTPWNAVMPGWAGFETCVPFTWPEQLQELLPGVAKMILGHQQAKVRRDWDMIIKAFPSVRYDEYVHAWFLINTRTFLYETPQTEAYPWEDRLALLPIADLFNHEDTGCQMTHWPDRYVITTNRNYLAGEEIYLSYGEHSSDFLLAEYGFFLAKNSWDEVRIDDLILSHLSEKQKAELGQRHLLGNYTLRAEIGACHRTQAALRLLCCTRRQWLDYIGKHDDGTSSQPKVDKLLIELLGSLLGTVKDTIQKVGKLQIGLESQRGLLAQRWSQIEATVEQMIKILQLPQVRGGSEDTVPRIKQ